MKIGFFDSGLGGTTVLVEALKEIKAEYIYLADNKNSPYGIKDVNKVKSYIFSNIDTLVNMGCEIIVVACNTATSIAINELREKYTDICIIGTEPAVKVAVDNNRDDEKRILVCATTITTKQKKLTELVNKLNTANNIDILAMDGLVPIAEEYDCNEDMANAYILDKLKDFNIKSYGYIVLGCTHFPLFRSVFSDIFGNDVMVIDGSRGIVKNLKNKLDGMKKNKNDVNDTETKITLVLTSKSNVFEENFKKITGSYNIDVIYNITN